MKTIFFLTAVLLLTVMLFGSCADTPDHPQDTEPPAPDSAADTSAETPEDPFALLRASGEEWIAYGLAAYENGKQAANLKEFFSDRANLTYLTLYDHFFTYDKEKAVPVAEALFAFIYNEYGAQAVSDLDKRCDYKSAYLKSLGLDVEYSNPPQVEAFLASMDFSSDATYKYIISFDNVTYYFKDFDAGTPQQYHGFLYYSTTGLFELIDYLKSNNLSEGLDTERKFNYYVTFDRSGYSKTVYSNGNMYITESYSTLHEAIHAMGITKGDNIWLSEGICEYFGKSLGFNDQIAAADIQILTMIKQGYYDEQANAGNAQYVLYKRIYEDYTARGGKMDFADAFDFRLYTDIIAKAELDADIYETLGYSYKLINKTDCNAVGSELSYKQATSLVLYLVDTYGIETVLSAYHSQDIAAAFGKDYEELKSDWLAYLYS
ncbi:MAG: hypothetical protein J5950_07600 [Clostridia bacterium]|nr:hypothetical protein [Clostridia bacterium]